MVSGAEKVKAMYLSFKEVFSQGRYLLLASLGFFTAFAFSLWINNLNFIVHVITSRSFGFFSKIDLILSLLGGIATSVTMFSAILILLMSVLFGVNASLLIYLFIRRINTRVFTEKNGAITLLATLGALFGAGCAVCGTYFLGALLASMGASGVLFLLPFGGKEFLFISVGLLLLSIFWALRGITAKNVC